MKKMKKEKDKEDSCYYDIKRKKETNGVFAAVIC